MASVYAQLFSGNIEHIVIADDDTTSVIAAQAAPTRAGLSVRALSVERPPHEREEPKNDLRGVYPRMSRLFNTGVRMAASEWISFLDDDNEFEPEHLETMMRCAQAHGADAVHSGRTMWWPDGSPHLDERWHTVSDPAEARRIFDLMCERGVRTRGTNVLLDRADSGEVPDPLPTSSVLQPHDPVLLVDQNVWLLRRDLLLEVPVPETFTPEEHRRNTAPDDKLLAALLRAGVRVVSTGLPTVRYYLGGQSNARQGNATRSDDEITDGC
jgi:hypothetical protein